MATTAQEYNEWQDWRERYQNPAYNMFVKWGLTTRKMNEMFNAAVDAYSSQPQHVKDTYNLGNGDTAQEQLATRQALFDFIDSAESALDKLWVIYNAHPEWFDIGADLPEPIA